MATRQTLSQTNSRGVYDKGVQVYSDVNAPDSLEMTLAGEPTAPPTGETVLWSPAGKSLLMKAPDGTVTTLGGAAAAGTKVSALSAVTTFTDSDVVPIVNNGVSAKASLNQLTAYFEQRARQNNAALASVTGYASETYLVGGNVGIPSGRVQAKTMYRLRFKVTKTAAGTATPIVNVKTGTAGTTADTTRCALTFGAQTAVVDSGMFEVFVTVRAIGSGTSVLNAIGMLTHVNGTTGLATTAAPIVDVTSSAFTIASDTMIGVSVNGGTSAAWTISMVQAELFNLA